MDGVWREQGQFYQLVRMGPCFSGLVRVAVQLSISVPRIFRILRNLLPGAVVRAGKSPVSTSWGYCTAKSRERISRSPQEIPEDITSKRARAKKWEEKKEEQAKEVSVANARSMTQAAKKYRAQLELIGVVEKILLAYLHSIDRKNEQLYQK